MDYHDFVNHISVPCCILSVDKKRGGDIRIVATNEPYRKVMGPSVYDNMLYYELVPKDLKYEDYCYRAAVLGQRMHAYVETRALGGWTDQQMIPLISDREDVGYCQFLFEFTKMAEASRMSNISHGVAALIIECGLTLMTPADLSDRVHKVAEIIMDFSSAKNLRVLLIDEEKREIINYCDLLAPVAPDKIASVSYEVAQSWEPMIGFSNGVFVKDAFEMDDLERRNPMWVRDMKNYDVTSLAMVPMRRDKKIIGYIYIVNFNVEKAVEVKELLEMTAFMIGAEVSNAMLMQKLEEMSSRDELTGIKNRNALMRLLTELNENRQALPLGVVYLDLNGLKTVNDVEGHEAGDILIRNAVRMMEQVFDHETLYRAGGDEFVAVLKNCTKMEFDRQVARFRQIEMSTDKINIAVGAQWADERTEDILGIFKSADEQMYSDKRAYYMRHPELNRRKR